MKISHCGSGSVADRVEDRLDRRVGEVDEVVALPVVPRARGQQRVEGLLPAGEGHRADHVGDRVAEGAQRRHRLLAVGDVAGVAGGEDQHLAPVPFLGQEGQRRRLAHHRPDGELVRGGSARCGGSRAGASRRRVDRVDDEAGEDLRARADAAGTRRRSTTPKLPPPPRIAQKRSGFSSALARRRLPSAVTTSAAIRLSMVMPNLRLVQPKPPPRVRPAMPVVELMPSGTVERVRLGRGVDVGEQRARLDPGGARRRDRP